MPRSRERLHQPVEERGAEPGHGRGLAGGVGHTSRTAQEGTPVSRITTLRLHAGLALGLATGLLVPVSAHAEPVTPSPTPTASASPTPSASPSPSDTPDPTPAKTQPPPGEDPSTPALPRASQSSASPAAPRPDAAPESARKAAPEKDEPGLAKGGDAKAYGFAAAAAGPATSTNPAEVGARFLEQQLVDSDYLLPLKIGEESYPQYGVVADAVLALDAAGTGQKAATAATAVLADNVVNYVGFGDPAEAAAGATAKLLNVAVAQGVDPTAFGGVDLPATLQSLESANGRFSDASAFGDYSNTFGQSFALIGLQRAGAGVSDEAVEYLATQQCDDGGFRTVMEDTQCTDASAAEVDATALAVQALIAVGGPSSPDVIEGLDFLAGQQSAAGGFGGGSLQPADNANSTGLAAQAMLAGGRSTQARAAVGFLRPLQYGCTFPDALRGAIAYDSTAYDDAAAAGAAAEVSDQDRRATAQALLAFAGVPLGSVTSSGATAEAPELACTDPTPTPTPTPTTTPTTTPTSPATATTTPTKTVGVVAAGGDTPASGASRPLAFTGTSLLAPLSVGLGLLLAGLFVLVLSRRRGAHA